jgi:hypothetical protein
MCPKTWSLITMNHGFLRGSSWLICYLWLMDMYISIKGQRLEWHMYFFIDQFDYSNLFIYLISEIVQH